MKRVLTLLLLMMGVSVSAQELTDAQKAAAAAAAAIAEAPKEVEKAPKPVYWKNSLMTNINFIQSSYDNWAKGGYDNFSVSGYIDANANYKKEVLYWNNRLQLDYGFIYSEDKPIMQKNKDRILFESSAGSQITKTLSYTGKFTFLSQFTDGYTYNTPTDLPEGQEKPTKRDWKDARTLKSALFSPAVVTLGAGMTWSPNAWLSTTLTPVTGGFTIVADKSLRNVYGMEFKKGHGEEELVKEKGGLVQNGDIMRAIRFEFGAQFSMDAKVKINDNFQASTQLILFSNYLHNPQNFRVNWDNRFMWKVAKYFSVNLSTSLVYDDTVLIYNEEHENGFRAIQFYEALQFGFSYTFSSDRK